MCSELLGLSGVFLLPKIQPYPSNLILNTKIITYEDKDIYFLYPQNDKRILEICGYYICHHL